MIRRISRFSSSVKSIFRDAKFVSSRAAFVVPGMAIMPCAATHARATCVTEQPLPSASFLISSTMARFL